MRRQIVIFRPKGLISPEDFGRIKTDILGQYVKNGVIVVPQDIEVIQATIGDEDGGTLRMDFGGVDRDGNPMRGLIL